MPYVPALDRIPPEDSANSPIGLQLVGTLFCVGVIGGSISTSDINLDLSNSRHVP